MPKGTRWLVVCALFFMVWGQYTYACDTMEKPPQASCCCDVDMTGCDTVSDDDGCHDAHAASASCCSLEYHSPAGEAVTASLVPDHPPAGLLIALVHWPSVESVLSRAVSRSDPADDDWLSARASAGRTVYLSTLRLRI